MSASLSSQRIFLNSKVHFYNPLDACPVSMGKPINNGHFKSCALRIHEYAKKIDVCIVFVINVMYENNFKNGCCREQDSNAVVKYKIETQLSRINPVITMMSSLLTTNL